MLTLAERVFKEYIMHTFKERNKNVEGTERKYTKMNEQIGNLNSKM